MSTVAPLQTHQGETSQKKDALPAALFESAGMRLQLTGLAPARSGGLSLTLTPTAMVWSDTLSVRAKKS